MCSSRGFAAAQCGKAPPYRRLVIFPEAAPRKSNEAQPLSFIS